MSETHQNCFIENWIRFKKETEPPTIYHRWCAIAGVGTLLGRSAWIQHGHTQIFPNQYVMIVGEAGTRKSTAIKTVRKLLQDVGYKTISADKTSKEKFLVDLEEGIDKSKDTDERLDVTKDRKNPTMKALFGVERSTEPAECLICADEFNAFLGHSNVEFIDLLTNLWDYDGVYENRIKNGRSVRIFNPTLSILGGNTNIGISMAFPLEAIGQGFFSRVLMVFSEPSGRRISFPPPPNPEIYKQLVEQLTRIKLQFKGQIEISPMAFLALDEIYHSWRDLEDIRFKSYSTRRFTHLLKLCLNCAAAREEKIITPECVTYANTILHYTEHFMPKALGEFGKARNSDVAAMVLEIIDKADRPLKIVEDLFTQVRRHLDSPRQLEDILKSLHSAKKIQITNKSEVLPNKQPPNFDKFPHCKTLLLDEWQETMAKGGLPL